MFQCKLLKKNYNLFNVVKGNFEKIVFLFLILYFIFYKDYYTCIFINNIINIAMMVVLIYTSIIESNTEHKNFKIQLIYFSVIVYIIVLNTISIKIILENLNEWYISIIYSVQAIVEYYQIKNISFYFMNKNLRESLKIKNIPIYKLNLIINYLIAITLFLGYFRISILLMSIRVSQFYALYNYLINEILNNNLQKLNENVILKNKRKKEFYSMLTKKNIILKETNQLIKKGQDNYNEIMESIYGAVFLFNANKLTYYIKDDSKFIDIPKEDMLGLNMNELINKYFNTDLNSINQSDNKISQFKVQYNNLDLEIFIVKINAEFTIIYINDITEVDRNVKYIEEMEEYLKTEKIKGEFFANISHELKTPINLIFSALQVNEIYLEENNVEAFAKNSNIIKQNCNRLVRTINNFIDSNNVSEGYTTPNYKIYNIVEIVENTAIACMKYIKLIKNTFIFDSKQEEIYVKCDKEMIVRIILNILSNSVKYGREHGKISIDIKVKNTNQVCITIKNNGLKIQEETIPYIFEKFTKLNKSFNRIREGSGLGMFLVKELIELQGGDIKLITNDEGNEFIITLPIAQKLEKYKYEHFEINTLEEKVDIEFSDIYIN